jgi:hypothetical protein
MLDIYSNKAFLYLPDGSLRTQIESALSSVKVNVESSTKIAAFEALRVEAPLSKGLSFFQPDFFAYVQRVGVPSCMVIQMVSDLSLPKEIDPEKLLHLNTLMLSFVRLSMNQQYAAVRANIMIVVGRADSARAEAYERDHSLFFKGMQTGNEQLDARIEMLKKDKAAFSRLFLIRFQKIEDLIKSSELMIKGFYIQIQTRQTLENKLKAYASPVISTQNEAPARVIYRIDAGTVYVDGEAGSADEYAALEAGQFHIVGALTTRNLRDVMDRIKTLVLTGAAGKKFVPDDEIVVTMLADCAIDATAATGLAQLFVSGLARFKKKKIIVSTVNDGILRKSQGYGMIKEFIRIDAY